tara:strand:+ start:22117 stop:22599 length:483 start_codon:yes stop_codon:yes gene_type:complete
VSDIMDLESGRSVNPQQNDEPEKGIVADMLRRGLKIVPVWLLISLLIWGVDGALSAAYGVALIFANFLAAALFLTWAARISTSALMFAALFGFLVRLGALTVAVIAVSKISFFAPVPLGITIIVSHLGLLVWETRYVSLSLAYPGLGPDNMAPKKFKETK